MLGVLRRHNPMIQHMGCKVNNFKYLCRDMENDNKLNIELSPEVAKGSYSNLSIITHSSNEFIIDFLKLLPGIPKAIVSDRIIMTPENIKRLSHALAENIGKYESKFGTIELHDQEPGIPNVPTGFNNPNVKS